jgi:hypothetical protein
VEQRDGDALLNDLPIPPVRIDDRVGPRLFFKWLAWMA